MKLSILSTLLLALLGLVRVATAADYTTLFDPATMQVGQTVGEYLVVKDYCPKTTECTAAEKVKYATSIAGRTGRLELPVSAGSDFEVSFNVKSLQQGSCSGMMMLDDNSVIILTLYMSDGSSFALTIGEKNCFHDKATVLYSTSSDELTWIRSRVNDVRLVSEQGKLKIGGNDVFLSGSGGVVKQIALNGTLTRIVISSINADEEYIYDIKTRGVQSGGTTQQGIAQCKANPASCGITTGTTTAATKIDGISTNAFVSPTSKMIAGVLISGGTKRTMVRASSVDGMVDPFVEIYTYPDRQLLGSNDVWASSTAAAELTQKKLAPARATDAAMIISLPPGLFTMEVSSRNGGSGASLIEVYDMAVFP